VQTAKALRLPRRQLARLLSERSGHGDFADYHEQFGHHEANMHCVCGMPTAPAHFIVCRRTEKRHLLLRDQKGRPIRPTEILTTDSGAAAFSAWLSATAGK